MPNHLTPEELSKELGIDRTEVIKVCVQEGVPIYQGKIDKFLFQAQLQAIGATAAARALPSLGYFFAAARFARGFAGGFASRRRLALLRLGDALLERLHQVDHRRVLDRLRLGQRLAGELRLQHRLQILAVLARQLLARVELAARLPTSWRARSSSAFFGAVASSVASSISACE